MEREATSEGPPRRRESWSLKAIVEDVAGRPIHELQDPDRPVHPYLRAKLGAHAARTVPLARTAGSGRGDELPVPDDADPVGQIAPPLVGPTARALYGPELEHHRPTLHALDAEPSPGRRMAPSRRPERIYLHYLLLHLDRLGDAALHYLRHAIDEELDHRRPADPPAGP